MSTQVDLSDNAPADRPGLVLATDRPSTKARPQHPPWLIATAAVTSALALFWVSAVALSANHGFDATDEGFYLLSYRWWRESLRTFTGVQFLYGPVFQLLGYDIAGLRLVRLLTVVGTLLIFGWAFMVWLRGRRPAAPPSRLWEVSGTAAIVAAGALTYSWLPLSPAYNDVTMLGTLLVGAIVLRMATHAEAGQRIRPLLACTTGPLAVAMLLARWSAVLSLAVAAIAAVIVLAPRGRGEVLRVLGWTLGSAVITVLLLLLLTPIGRALPQMLAVNKLVVADNHSPTGLLGMYVTSFVTLGRAVLTRHWLLLVAGVLAVVLRGRRLRWLAVVIALAGLGLSGYRLAQDRAFIGGPDAVSSFAVGILAVLFGAMAVGVTALIDRRRTSTGVSSLTRTGWRSWAVIAMVALIPVTYGIGTGDQLYYMAVNCFAAWVALMIAIATGIEATPLPARALAATTLTAAVALAVAIGSSGVWAHPYRTAGVSETTSTAVGVPALASLKVDPRSAQRYQALYDELRPFIQPPGRAVMAFDRLSGVVLALDGKPVGEAWYSVTDTTRTAADIRAECADHHPWWGTRIPIVIFNRPPTDLESGALQACGLDLGVDYRFLPDLSQATGLRVYVPAQP